MAPTHTESRPSEGLKAPTFPARRLPNSGRKDRKAERGFLRSPTVVKSRLTVLEGLFQLPFSATLFTSKQPKRRTYRAAFG